MIVTEKYPFLWLDDMLKFRETEAKVWKRLKKNSHFLAHYPHFIKRHALVLGMGISVALIMVLFFLKDRLPLSGVSNPDLHLAILTAQITIAALLLPIVMSVVTSSLKKTGLSSIVGYYYRTIRVVAYVCSLGLSILFGIFLQINLAGCDRYELFILAILSIVWFIFNLSFSLIIIWLSINLLSPEHLKFFIKAHSTEEVFNRIVETVKKRNAS